MIFSAFLKKYNLTKENVEILESKASKYAGSDTPIVYCQLDAPIEYAKGKLTDCLVCGQNLARKYLASEIKLSEARVSYDETYGPGLIQPVDPSKVTIHKFE